MKVKKPSSAKLMELNSVRKDLAKMAVVGVSPKRTSRKTIRK
jgi:hypothetical protein